jgi:hypothetical protein
MATATPPARPGPAPAPPPAPVPDDWPAHAADSIERFVGTVRDKTTGPALTAARAVVYGTFAVLVGIAVLILAIVGAVRLIDNYLPDAWVGEDHMWVSYLILGVVFFVAGIVLWMQRLPRRGEPGR